MHIKTVILLGNFSFGFINFVNVSTTFFIQGFLTCFYFFIKTRFNVFFYSWGQRFLHLWYILETSNWQNLHYNHYSFFLQVGPNSIANFDGGAHGWIGPLDFATGSVSSLSSMWQPDSQIHCATISDNPQPMWSVVALW